MTLDPAVIPGLLLLAAQLAALAAVGYVVVRVALRQADDRVALAQGLVVGPALWGLLVNFVMYAVPGLAGAGVGWGMVLAIGAGLTWRAPDAVRPRPRVAAWFVVAVLALFWVALASRQLLSIPDTHTQLGLAASIRAGLFPPELAWNPGISGAYHHGIPLMVGLLTPPIGPDLALVTELLGAWAWMSFTLVIATLVLQRASGFAMAVTAPLLLSAGVWTFTWVGNGLLTLPVPTGLPAAGLRASLADIYWPSLDMPWGEFVWEFRETALGNIWKPGFPLAYGLLVVVLERAARASDRSWSATVTQGGLVGFIGLLNTTLAPVALALWAGLEAVHLGRTWRGGMLDRRVVVQSAAGLALAVLLLLGGGARITGMLGGAMSPGLALGWNEHSEGWLLLGRAAPGSGGIAQLGLGPVVVAAIATLLARRDRLVLTLVVGAAGLTLAFLVLHYPPTPYDLSRLAGHARNLALVALLLALGVRLAHWQPRRRYVASALLLALIVWPTVVGPIRYLGQAIGEGVELTNAPRDPATWFQGRYSLASQSPSDHISAYIRDHTPVDARVLTPTAPYTAVTFATGRPSAAGFSGHLHLRNWPGPAYLDAVRYLEPAAFRQLEIAYVHATDDWVAGLPDRASRRLANPALFELLTRGGDQALYRVRPAFLALETAPAPESFEALRQAVPASLAVYVPAELQSLESARAAWALSHTRLFGVRHVSALHLLTPWPGAALAEQIPDLIVLPLSIEPRMLPPDGRQPIWWSADEGIAVYAPNGAVVAPIRPPPAAAPPPKTLPVNVRVSDVRATDSRLTFTVTIDDHAPDQWTGQDWQLVAGEASPWAIPTALEPDGRTPVIAQWFAGQAAPGRDTTTHHYAFDARTSRLALRDDDRHVDIATSGDGVGEGIWMLALRLEREVDRGAYVAHEDVALVPLLQIEISATGEVTGFAYGHLPGAEIEPGTGG